MAGCAAGSRQQLWDWFLRLFALGSDRLREATYRRLVADLCGIPPDQAEGVPPWVEVAVCAMDEGVLSPEDCPSFLRGVARMEEHADSPAGGPGRRAPSVPPTSP